MIQRPQGRVGDDGGVGTGCDIHPVIEIGPDRRSPGGPLCAPVVHEAGAGDVEMILHGDHQTQRLDAGEVLFGGHEAVLNCPALTHDGLIAVGCFIGVKDLVDSGVAHGVCPDPPAHAVEFAHDGGETIGGDELQAAERAVLAERLGVGIAHPAAFEAAVHHQLHANDAESVVAFAGLNAGGFEVRADAGCGRVRRRREQCADADGEQSATLHLLQHFVLREADAGVAHGREAGLVHFAILRGLEFDLLFERLARDREGDQGPGAVDQFAVGLAIGVAADLAAIG